MGLVMAFVVGYLVGARAGEEGLREVSESVTTIRQAEELGALMAALRSHAGASLKQAAALVEEGSADRFSASQVVNRVRDLIDRAGLEGFRPVPGDR